MKKFLALLMAMAMVLAMVACGNTTNNGGSTNDGGATNNGGSTDDGSGDGSTTGSGVELKFVTGGDQGTYYGFGSVLAQSVTSSTGTKVTAVVSNGSQDNIEQMDMNTAQMGFVHSDLMSFFTIMPLAVSPEIKCTDRGLLDVAHKRFLPLIQRMKGDF